MPHYLNILRKPVSGKALWLKGPSLSMKFYVPCFDSLLISGSVGTGLVLYNNAMLFDPTISPSLPQCLTSTPQEHCSLLMTIPYGENFPQPKGSSFSAKRKENPMKAYDVCPNFRFQNNIQLSFYSKISIIQSLMGQNLQIPRISAQKEILLREETSNLKRERERVGDIRDF